MDQRIELLLEEKHVQLPIEAGNVGEYNEELLGQMQVRWLAGKAGNILSLYRAGSHLLELLDVTLRERVIPLYDRVFDG